MKTYTFKIKVDSDKVVCAMHMQLEQFYDSVKLTPLKGFIEKYPEAYITASDYPIDGGYIDKDFYLSDVASLFNSSTLKDYMLSDNFCDFVHDDYDGYVSLNDKKVAEAHKLYQFITDISDDEQGDKQGDKKEDE